MSFWKLSDGTHLEKQESFDSDAIELIPDNTKCIAGIDDVAWGVMKSNDDNTITEDYISITWRLIEPKEYRNQCVFQKIKVYNEKEKTKDRALRMLSAIDTIAGGKLQKIDEMPSDRQLKSALESKRMCITVREWDFDGKKGNWVSAVEPIEKEKPKQEDDEEEDIPL